MTYNGDDPINQRIRSVMQISCDIKVSKGTSGSGHMKSATGDWGLGVGFQEDKLEDEETLKSTVISIRSAISSGCSACSCCDPVTAKEMVSPKR